MISVKLKWRSGSPSKVRGKQGEEMATKNITGRPGGEQPSNEPEIVDEINDIRKRRLSRAPEATRARRKMIIQAVIEGESLKDAAISAGYSPKTAGAQATAVMKHPEAQQAFARVMEEAGISDQILAQKIRDLLDAQETKYFQKDGIVTDQREVAALETQRKTAELAAKLKGHLKDRSEVDVNIGLMALVVAAVRERSEEDDGFDV
ncbi:MAG: hypothetical protein WCO89_10985 [Syntrophus sp. (in: bacteria)]